MRNIFERGPGAGIPPDEKDPEVWVAAREIEAAAKEQRSGTSGRLDSKEPASLNEAMHSVSTWEDLIDILKTVDGITGSKQFYPKSELIEQVNKIYGKYIDGSNPDDGITLENLTTAGGFRDAVKGLIDRKTLIKEQQ